MEKKTLMNVVAATFFMLLVGGIYVFATTTINEEGITMPSGSFTSLNYTELIGSTNYSNRYTVTSVSELESVVGSDRTIQLMPGTYILSSPIIASNNLIIKADDRVKIIADYVGPLVNTTDSSLANFTIDGGQWITLPEHGGHHMPMDFRYHNVTDITLKNFKLFTPNVTMGIIIGDKNSGNFAYGINIQNLEFYGEFGIGFEGFNIQVENIKCVDDGTYNYSSTSEYGECVEFNEGSNGTIKNVQCYGIKEDCIDGNGGRTNIQNVECHYSTDGRESSCVGLGRSSYVSVNDVRGFDMQSGDVGVRMGGSTQAERHQVVSNYLFDGVGGTGVYFESGYSVLGIGSCDNIDVCVNATSQEPDTILIAANPVCELSVGTCLFINTTEGNIDFERAITVTTLNTGHGDNELYAMNQDLETTDSPTFAGATITNDFNIEKGTPNIDLIDTSYAGLGRSLIRWYNSSGGLGSQLQAYNDGNFYWRHYQNGALHLRNSANNDMFILDWAGGEFKAAGISGDGTGKAVCIKADGNLGTCADAVGAGGTCTCS